MITQLISKIQYKSFETGEFVEERERSFEEIIELIEAFPWESQREHIVISLTNPSITVHGQNNEYLKLALFYNGKFVLYYFDQEQTLFSKSLTYRKDAYKYIKHWFDAPSFDTHDFKKENTLFQSNLKHFISQDFCYGVTPVSARKFLLSTSGFGLLFTFFMLMLFLIKPHPQMNALAIAALLLMFFLFGGGLNLILFFNHYLYAKNKMLIMSRGNETFYFGDRENLIKYNKKDIIRFITYKVRSNRSPINGFAIVRIELKNGIDIDIPNILIDHSALAYKLNGIPHIEKNKFPLI